jgi:hypothetical protein
MIRGLAIGTILVSTFIAPAFAEQISLKCTGSSGTVYITFDAGAHTVSDGTNTYPMQMTDSQVTWQFKSQPGPPIMHYNTYNRNSAQLVLQAQAGSNGGVTWTGGIATYTCVQGQRPF